MKELGFGADEMKTSLRALKIGGIIMLVTVTVGVAGYMIAGWPFIDQETRLAVNETLDRAMQLQPRGIVRESIALNYDDRLLPYLENNEDLATYYKSELKRLKK